MLRHLELFDCNNLNEREHWILEREANIFTSEFLMHKLWVKRLARPPITPFELSQLRKTFGVSWEALIYRLDELGIESKENIERNAKTSRYKRLECFLRVVKTFLTVYVLAGNWR